MLTLMIWKIIDARRRALGAPLPNHCDLDLFVADRCV
jgi:hypothetical protein